MRARPRSKRTTNCSVSDRFGPTANGDQSPTGKTVGRGPPAERSPRQLLEFGVCNLDKPPGPSAHQISGWVRDLASETHSELLGKNGSESAGSKAGVDRAAHAGTLDPKVTGCLPVLTGVATRLSGALLTPKEYVAVLETHRSLPEEYETILEEFVGPIYQKPPRKSAVSRRLRVREIYEMELLDVDTDRRQALLRVGCESGTYIRKLCHDLGLALGTGGHMGHLRRTRAAPFCDRDLVTLFDLADALAFALEGDGGTLREVVEPAERALVHLPRVEINESAAREVANGAPLYAPGVRSYREPEQPLSNGSEEEGRSGEKSSEAGGTAERVACYTPDGAVICLGDLVGDPEAESGTVVDTDRVLVRPLHD
jgi:H/ACA ribonucleoprotein complex subunit 4